MARPVLAIADAAGFESVRLPRHSSGTLGNRQGSESDHLALVARPHSKADDRRTVNGRLPDGGGIWHALTQARFGTAARRVGWERAGQPTLDPRLARGIQHRLKVPPVAGVEQTADG